MPATSLDLSQIKTDALASASAFRALIGLGTLATQSPTGTPSASTFLRGDYSWQTIDLSGYLPLAGGTMTGQLAINQATANTSVLTSTGYSLTGSNAQSLMDLSGTWNTTGTPTLIKANVTDTASNANSLLMDLQVGGTSRLQLDKSNNFRIGVTSSFAPFHLKTLSSSAFLAIQPGIGSISGIYFGDSSGDFTHRILKQGFDQDYTVVGTMSFRTGSPSTNRFSIDGNGLAVFTGTVEQRNSTNAQTFRLYNTYTDASNYERGQLAWASNEWRIGTAAAGTGTQRNFVLGSWNSAGTWTAGLTIGTTGDLVCSKVLSTYNAATSMYGQIRLYGSNTVNARSGLSFEQTPGTAIEKFFGIVHPNSNTGAFVWQGYNRPSSAWHEYMRLEEEGNLILSPRWNNAATTFTGILANVTDTASNANSLLMDLQVGGSSRLSFRKDGVVNLPSIFNAPVLRFGSDASIGGFGSNALRIFDSGGAARAMLSLDPTGLTLQSTVAIAWSPNSPISGSSDLFLLRDASDTLAQRRSTNPQVHRVYNTFTDSSNYERAKIAWESSVLRIGTEKAGTGSARALEFQTDGTTRLTIGTNGFVSCALGFTAGASVYIGNVHYMGAANRALLHSPADKIWCLSSNNGINDDFNRLQLGGTTSSFPSIKRNSAAINFRLADDTGDCDITAKAATFSGNVTISAVNLVTDTTTGTKIGTATTQKLGFFDKTPVVQPTAVADATDAASVITQLNALLSRMRDLGLIAT